MKLNTKIACGTLCVLIFGGAYQHGAAQNKLLFSQSKVYAAANKENPQQTRAYIAQIYSQRDKLAPLAPGSLKLTG